jgi:hypothetical protein
VAERQHNTFEIPKAWQTSSFVTTSSAGVTARRQIATDCDFDGWICSMKKNGIHGCDATPTLAQVSQPNTTSLAIPSEACTQVK